MKIGMRLADETVGLSQAWILVLFQTLVPNISMHIRNVFKPVATIKKFLTDRQKGSRPARRQLDHYTLT